MFEPGKLNTKENKEEFKKLVKIRKSNTNTGKKELSQAQGRY